jgi:hypothetical protein
MNKPDIQMLLDHLESDGMVLSCYADARVSEGFEPHWRQHLKTETRELRRLLADKPEAAERFDKNLKAVWSAIEQARSPGVAVFCLGSSDQVVALGSDVPYPNCVVLDEEPYVVPLLMAVCRRRAYLVVATDTHHGRLYSATGPTLHLLAELDQSIPPKERASGERWGKQQATITRHREDQILHYMRELVGRTEESWDDRFFQGIILLGQRETIAQLRELLPKRLARRVVAESPYAWATGENGIREKVERLQDSLSKSEDALVLAEVENRKKQAFALAEGPVEVLNALRNGQAAMVLIRPGLGEAGSRCTNCGYVFTPVREICENCGSACERVNLWQEILKLAFRHSTPVQVVQPRPDGINATGSWEIAALLERDRPQWATPIFAGTETVSA